MTVVKETISASIKTLCDSATGSKMSNQDFADGLAQIIHDAILSQTITISTLVATDSVQGGVTLTSGSCTTA